MHNKWAQRVKIGIHFNKILPSSFHLAVTRSFAEAVRRELYPPECRGRSVSAGDQEDI